MTISVHFQGDSGAKGDRGSPGVLGMPGFTGAPGAPGAPGEQGRPGPKVRIIELTNIPSLWKMYILHFLINNYNINL